MDRRQANAFLARSWVTTASALGVTDYDEPEGWQGAVDAALLALGTAWSDLRTATVDAADEPTFLALLLVFGVRRLLEACITKAKSVSVGDVGISKTYDDYARLEKLLALYERDPRVVALVSAVPQMTMGRLCEDYLEPAVVEFG